MDQEDKIKQNLEKCTHFQSCHQNFCPQDLELSLRSGGRRDWCRYSREPKAVKIRGRDFISGGSVMPDAPLNFVPECNLDRLNTASKKRWIELHKKVNKI